jgi:hypothetical protein
MMSTGSEASRDAWEDSAATNSSTVVTGASGTVDAQLHGSLYTSYSCPAKTIMPAPSGGTASFLVRIPPANSPFQPGAGIVIVSGG